jgi:tellurite resistance-related uncharacterized protein
MERRIVGFVQDDEGDWAARLDCLHRQHVRHQPPFRVNEWTQTEEGRASRIGTTLDCPLCDRCELPADLELRRTTPTWDAGTMPPALGRAHRVAPGTWGRLRVESGELRFQAETTPRTDRIVHAGEEQPIPPDVEHHVEPMSARFAVDFLGPAATPTTA